MKTFTVTIEKTFRVTVQRKLRANNQQDAHNKSGQYEKNIAKANGDFEKWKVTTVKEDRPTF